MSDQPGTTIPDLVEALRASQRSGVLRDLEARRVQLRQLQRMLQEQEDPILRAMATDLGKPPMEAYAAEIGLVLGEIKTTEAWARTYLLRPAVNPAELTSVMILTPKRESATKSTPTRSTTRSGSDFTFVSSSGFGPSPTG